VNKAIWPYSYNIPNKFLHRLRNTKSIGLISLHTQIHDLKEMDFRTKKRVYERILHKEIVMARSRMNKHLTKKQLNELKDQVLAERERVQNKLQVEQPHKKMTKTDSGRDEVDSANDDIIRHTELRFIKREGLYLKKLIKTLGQFEDDEYGNCEDCGESISFTRLSARPTSTMCITCKEESERGELHSYQGNVPASLR
jgi:DnaK suppressor protein